MYKDRNNLTEQQLIAEGLALVFAARLNQAKVRSVRNDFHGARISLADAETVLTIQENYSN
jgi:hypothetical protein